MNKSEEHIVDKIIDEGMKNEVLEGIDVLRNDAEIIPHLSESLSSLHETLSSTDWAKMNAIIALIWSRLDKLISTGERGNNIQQKISNDIRSMLQKI